MYIPIWVIFAALIFGYFYHTNRMKEKRKRKEFSPFRIHILPNWYELLIDYKLIDDEAWKQLIEKDKNNNSTEYNVLKNGITFTVLKSAESSGLVYYDSRNSFHSKVDFREKIEEIIIPRKIGGSPFTFSPQFWVKSRIDGYEIGITTLESHEKVLISGDDKELIKITAIPYSLFYWENNGAKELKQLEEQLRKYGWSKNKAHEEFKKDVLFIMPDELEHKYFAIYYEYI